MSEAPITDDEVRACLEPLPTEPLCTYEIGLRDYEVCHNRAKQMQGVIRRLAHPAVTQTGWRNLYLNWRQIAEKLERGITIARASCERKDKALRELLIAEKLDDGDPRLDAARVAAERELSDTQEPT